MNKTSLAILLSFTLVACSDDITSEAGADFNDGTTDKNVTTEFNRKALLTDVTDQVLVPTINSFVDVSGQQKQTTGEMCQAIANNSADKADKISDAKQAWRDAMDVWQQLEVMQIGPVLQNDATLRNKIYSWPVINACTVDQDVGYFEAGEFAGRDYDIASRTHTRRGLDALEYLLFAPSLNHSCSSDSLAPNNWNQRSEQERELARCLYAEEVAKDIESSANELLSEWQGDSGYALALKNAAEGVNFDDEQDAINRITDAMFYVDSITKDAKLAAPIGLSSNSCGNAACAEDIESRLSQHAVQNIKNNLIGLQKLFVANDENNNGFDDFLKAVDAESLATTMKQDIQAAIDAADAFSTDYEQAVLNNPDQVQNLHQAVKTVTDNLKSVFIVSLALTLPTTSAGDAD
jgi:predicted lipoprotein